MTELALHRPVAVRIPHRAWTVAAATCLSILAAAAAFGAPNVLILPLSREFGWDVATLSAASAVRLAAFGVAGLLASPLTTLWGVRRVACTALAMTAAGLLASLAITHAWQLMLLWGVLVGSGAGLVFLMLGATVAARWFATRRGLVIGLFGAAATAGQLAMLPLLAWVADVLGWRVCLLVPCALMALGMLAIHVLVPERPEDIGVRPYGARQGEAGTQPLASRSVGDSLRKIVRSGPFWVLFGSFAVCGTTTAGLVQAHLVPFCADIGVGPVPATGLLAGMGLLSLLGSAAAGWLSDRFAPGWLLFWFYGLRGVSLVSLPFTDLSFVGLSLFATVYGLDWVATVPPMVRILLDRLGSPRAPAALGMVFAGHQLGAAAAAYGAGVARIGLESYLPSFLAAGALCFLAACVLPFACGRNPDGPAAQDAP
ncbi:MFS transporter [Methylobacterium terricola]|uniref:MFS transporter n=1 Tax=Methylobacterium terricola TaxID=2583531 RepID=A0A5C4L8M1_9HYPH|nr:MFS transporter [Methylobacterium terricola]TNC08038.1 MFS transporter [Methylobacterium terricola]